VKPTRAKLTAHGRVVLLDQSHWGGSDAHGIASRCGDHRTLRFNRPRERAIPSQGIPEPDRDLPDPVAHLSDQQFLSGDAAADTQAPFTYKDACIELNPHVGGNPTTAAQSRKAVVDFLQALFKLGSREMLLTVRSRRYQQGRPG
jgi:hypothetical protein